MFEAEQITPCVQIAGPKTLHVGQGGARTISDPHDCDLGLAKIWLNLRK